MPTEGDILILYLCPLCLDFLLFPGAFGRLHDQTFFNGAGRHSNVFDFAVHHGLNPLQIREKPSFGDAGDVSADTALFLGFTTAPNVVPLGGTLAG